MLNDRRDEEAIAWAESQMGGKVVAFEPQAPTDRPPARLFLTA